MVDPGLKRDIELEARICFEQISSDSFEAGLEADDCVEPTIWQMQHSEDNQIRALACNIFHTDHPEFVEIVRSQVRGFFP